MIGDDYDDMDRTDHPRPGCDLIREALSANLDQEPHELDQATVEHHVAGCAACRSFADDAAALHRRTRVRPADLVPNLAAPILDAVPMSFGRPAARRWRPAGRTAWARVVLAAIAAVLLVLAAPELIVGPEAGHSVHIAREIRGWNVAVAIAWVAVALRPSRAVGLLPFAAALAAVMVGTATLDVVEGYQPAVAELQHGLHVIGVTCTWLLAKSASPTERLVAIR